MPIEKERHAGLPDRAWEIHDGTASEKEMADVLFGLVRMLKPELVVETGTYRGHTTAILACAVHLNGMGRLVTCDTTAYDLEPCDFIYEFRQTSSLYLPELPRADFVFSDSDQSIRKEEYALVKPGCVFIVHDTRLDFTGRNPQGFLGDFVRELGGLTFEAGRGFGILIKPR